MLRGQLKLNGEEIEGPFGQRPLLGGELLIVATHFHDVPSLFELGAEMEEQKDSDKHVLVEGEAGGVMKVL